ncbi:cytochrome P450 [Oerskovia flava]|uniref:cytochrome P450 n=1 Tax=Oerskovia flava TaxID=2986422 RepID=UPI00223E9D07|nr:cytochrome P450 [Oerskovia sp. JB1-3-2]
MPSLTTSHELRVLWRARPAMAAVLLAGHAAAGPRRARRGASGTRARQGGLRKVPGLGWVSADPVVARTVLTDHRHFTIVGEGGVGHLWAQILGDWVLDLFDGPGHHDLRTRSRELFTESSAAALVSGAWSDQLVAARGTLRDGGTVDVARLATVLVGRMMISLLGIPTAGPPTDDDAARAFATGERLASIALGSAGSTYLSGEQVAAAREIVAELTSGVPDGWRSAPPDTLLGRCRELGLGLDETTGLASLLMVAGTETSASAMSRTAALLVDTGEQHRLLARMSAERADPRPRAPGEPDAVENVVREGLRVTSPASVIGRGVAADVEVAGRTLRAGERIMLLTWSANAGAGPFRADRPYVRETRQLWFGAGRHLCLGAALARAEIAALLHALWDDGAPLRVVDRRAKSNVLVPGYERLVLTRA